MFSTPIISWICEFPQALNVFNICNSLFLILLFLFLCRSYLPAFRVISAILSLLCGLLALEMFPETVYFHVGVSFTLLIAMALRTGSLKLVLLSGVCQIVILLTKFQEKLTIVVREEEPDIFVARFIKVTLFYFLLALISSVGLVKDLERRTAELTEAKSALEKAIDQQKTFIFSFSHELRNPINSLLGNLQLALQGEKLSTKAAEMVNIAKICGELLLHNINNVLDTGKHDLGKLEVNPVPTQVHELFQRTWSIYSELLRQKRLKSQLRIEKELPSLLTIDSHKVNQIMLNLIGNAIKFTEKGSVIVTTKWLKCPEINEKCFQPTPYDDVDEGLFEKEENLSAMNTSKLSQFWSKFLVERRPSSSTHEDVAIQEETRGILKIIVKDTGSGMKKEALEKLFQKFSQVSEIVSQRNIGTGLGLFITKEICFAMGGEIRAYSKIGTGTTFVVCIPAVAMPVENRPRVNAESVLRQLTEKHLKALVADDSPFNVNLMSNYFSQFGGSTVAGAYNGYDAFMKYKDCMISNTEIDVVILDIDMPIMDGRKVCDNIRQYEKEKGLKPVMIILISGNYDKEQIDEYINNKKGHKADCFLRKPVSLSDFSRAVYNLTFH